MMIDDDNDVVEAVSATVFLVSPPPLPTDAVCVDYSDALKQVRACVRTCVRACYVCVRARARACVCVYIPHLAYD
eukprot:m.135570 g.135570  ORF g.135570 m.135570 type:complete len:75 (-) comp29802_c0_seq2:237-461(-)